MTKSKRVRVHHRWFMGHSWNWGSYGLDTFVTAVQQYGLETVRAGFRAMVEDDKFWALVDKAEKLKFETGQIQKEADKLMGGIAKRIKSTTKWRKNL